MNDLCFHMSHCYCSQLPFIALRSLILMATLFKEPSVLRYMYVCIQDMFFLTGSVVNQLSSHGHTVIENNWQSQVRSLKTVQCVYVGLVGLPPPLPTS